MNNDYKGSIESYKKLSSKFECAKFRIVERNFWIVELERKVKEAEQKHSELLILRQKKQKWEKVESFLREELAKDQESAHITEEKLSIVREVFNQASNA